MRGSNKTGIKFQSNKNYRPWPSASHTEYQELVLRVSSRFSRKLIVISEDKDSNEILNSITSESLGSIKKFFTESIISAFIFRNRAIASTKFGKYLLFIPNTFSFIYMLLMLTIASGFNSPQRLTSQLLILLTWSIFEQVILKASLALKYEKGMLKNLHLSRRSIQFGNVLYGISAYLPASILVFIILAIFETKILLSGFLLLLISIIYGTLIGMTLSTLSTQRDLKFIIPTITKIFFLVSPVFPRETNPHGVLTFLYSYSPFNFPFFLTGVGYVSSNSNRLILLTIGLLASLFCILQIRNEKVSRTQSSFLATVTR